MDERKYNNQEIVEYLLGSLPAPQAEKFDELSVTDDEFADALNSAEKDLADAYARNELTGATLEKFKSQYLASDWRRKKVDFAQTLQIFESRKAARPHEIAVSAEDSEQSEPGGFLSSLNFFKNLNAALTWSFAAALLIALLGGFWIFNHRFSKEGEIARENQPPVIAPPGQGEEQKTANTNSEESSPITIKPKDALPAGKTAKIESNAQPQQTPAPEKTSAPPKISIASFILPPSMRGGGQIKSLSVPRNTTDVRVSLELETDDFPAYRVALTDESGSVNLWQSGRIKASKGADNYLNVRFPAQLLKSKIYNLVVSGIDADGKTEITGNYTFRSVLR